MSRTRRWRDLLPGVAALAVLGGIVGAVLLFGQVGALHGRTFALYATVGEATGLSAGSEVWLAGEKVGVVRSVDFRPPSSDTTQRLLLTLTVLEKNREIIRRDAPVQIRPGGNLIGAPVVALGIGSPAARAVRAGDTLRSTPSREIDRARADYAAAAQQVPAIVNNLRVLGTQLRAARGTLGALGIGGVTRVSEVASSATGLMGRARNGNGTVGRFMRGGQLADRASAALARLDSVRALVTAPSSQTSLGRFRRDSTLMTTIAEIQSEMDVVSRLLEEPRGTAGRLQHDSALVQEIARGRLELSALTADIKRNPLRYIAF